MSGFDAAARLAQGVPAVGVVEEYVAACARLGYHHPDLTVHANQVREWYGSEDGLDLRALDADCASLAAAATTAESAAAAHDELGAEVARAWSGRGALSAGEFVWRSGRAGAEVGAALRRTAEALVTLRDELWRAVDAKVDTVERIDAGNQAQRAEWLAAARTVNSGAGDVATASELVDLALTPFVNDQIVSDWLPAMRSAIASIGAAYDTAIAQVAAGRGVVFEVPGGFGPGPGWQGSSPAGVAQAPAAQAVAPAAVPAASVVPASVVPAAVVPAAVVPAAAEVPAASGPPPQFASAAAPFSPAVPPPTDPVGASTALPPAPPSSSPLGDLGGGAPSSLGGGLAGFGQQLADLIGSLFGSAESAATEPAALDADVSDDALLGDEDATDEDATDDEGTDEEDGDEEDEEDEDEDEDEDVTDEDPTEGEDTVDPAAEDTSATDVEPDPTATTVPPPPAEPPPPVEPPPPASPMMADGLAAPAEPTPCEIAADELPQVGE